MSDSSAVNALPATLALPLAPFERYMLADSRRYYPMVCASELIFSGRADRAAFEKAMAATIASHPLSTARVKRGRRWRLHWEYELPPRALSLHWIDRSFEDSAASAGVDAPREALGLPRQRGFHVEVIVGPGDATTVQFFFHHAICDGMGFFLFLSDLLRNYDRMFRGEDFDAAGARAAAETLATRTEMDLAPPAAVSWWKTVLTLPREAAHWFFTTPARLHARLPEVPCSTSLEEPLVFSFDLDEELSSRLNAVARTRKASVNAMLLGDLALTIHDWNAARGGDVRRPMRLVMPINMRHLGPPLQSAANKMSYAFLDVAPSQCESPESLPSRLDETIRAIHHWKLGGLFLGGMSVVARIPGGLWAATRLPRPLATAVLSNVGSLERVMRTTAPIDNQGIYGGNLRLTRFSGCPPVRPRTPLAILASSYRRVLTITAAIDRRVWAVDDAEHFLQRYRDRLHDSARAS